MDSRSYFNSAGWKDFIRQTTQMDKIAKQLSRSISVADSVYVPSIKRVPIPILEEIKKQNSTYAQAVRIAAIGHAEATKRNQIRHAIDWATLLEPAIANVQIIPDVTRSLVGFLPEREQQAFNDEVEQALLNRSETEWDDMAADALEALPQEPEHDTQIAVYNDWLPKFVARIAKDPELTAVVILWCVAAIALSQTSATAFIGSPVPYFAAAVLRSIAASFKERAQSGDDAPEDRPSS